MTWLSTLRESLDIVRVGVANEIRIRFWTARMRWHLRELDPQPAIDEAIRNAERELLNQGWGRPKDCRCHSDAYLGNEACPVHEQNGEPK